METIHHLRDVLSRALSSYDSHDEEQELFDELMIQKPRLLSLFEVGPRNPQEQREIESGKPTINNKATAVNADFARQAIFLSQQLECSEKYIAGILHNVMTENPHVGPTNAMELAVSTFHKRRRNLVDSLRFLLDATEAAELHDAPENYKRIAKFVKNELLPGTRGPMGEVTLALKLLKEIEQMELVIGKADTARKNAGSNTAFPAAPGAPTLGLDILNSRHESLKYERRYVAVVLCSISKLGYLGPTGVQQIIDWLASHSDHPMTYYMLTATLLSFDPIDPFDTLTSSRQSLATDASLLTFMVKKMEPSAVWKDPTLKATILLKWTMFQTEARHHDATLEHKAGFRNDELETQVWNAVQASAFTYLSLSVVHLRGKVDGGPAAVILNGIPTDQQDQRELPPADFVLTLFLTIESLIRSLITHASSELRKIKQRQEDLILASARDRNRPSSRFAASLPPETDKADVAPRQDIAMLYTLIGLLYSSLPPERALQFWGSGPSQHTYRPSYQETLESTSGRLPAFLQWVVWSTPIQDQTMLSSLYDMLAGLANGQQCSELAYNFMARGGGEVVAGSSMTTASTNGPTVSWTMIFGLLESWATNAASPPQQPRPIPSGLGSSLQNLAPPQAPAQKFVLGPQDVLLARSFLRVLSTVVQHSVAVRTTIAGHNHFRAIPTLLSLIPLGFPLELKGAIFDTLSAFCAPGAGAAGVEICRAVWQLMDRLEVINVRVGPGGGYNMSMAAGKGIEVELVQVEAVHNVYPSTIPFLKLLTTLIHTPKQLSAHNWVASRDLVNTVPERFGSAYRPIGIGPFTAFVVDNVFANIPNRGYSNPSDRWQINDLCLTFVERSLASFDLESLVSGPNDPALTKDSLEKLFVHPGYEIMKKLLTATTLQGTILTYVVEGLSGFENNTADEEPFFRNTITRVLRIIHRVLEIQDVFLDVFISVLGDFNRTSAFIGQVHSRSFFTRFEQVLSFGPQYIPAIAAYTSYPTHPEIVLLSVKILSKLSLCVPHSTLVSLIQRSQDSERILAGFTRIVAADSLDDVEQAEQYAEASTGAGAPGIGEHTDSLEQAIRVAALDLFIQDTDPNRPYPNIGHFLLFGCQGAEQTIQDPHALGAQERPIHVLLDHVNIGVPRLKGKRKERESAVQTTPLFATLPPLAERYYRIIHQLCVHRKTSEPTARYLRTSEDFFARQVAAVSPTAPPTPDEQPIQVVYNDGSRVETTVASLSSFLRLRSYIFDLAALELHVLTNMGHFKPVTELLEILFGTDIEYEEEHDFSTFHELGQSPMRIIGFMQSLLFDWADSLSVEPIQLQYTNQLNLQACIRQDSSGCSVVDRSLLSILVRDHHRLLTEQKSIATQPQEELFQKESLYIFNSCAIENNRRKLAHARATGFESWRRLLDLALTKCFDRLPHSRRENMLFDLLHVLPAAIRSENIEQSTSILLSETVLSSITKLREDRQHQVILQSMGGDAEAGSLPAERLHNILRNILEGILDNKHVELVRGNLYAALINFIHLVRSSPESKFTPSESETNPFAVSLSVSTLRDSLSFSTRRSPSLTPSISGERSPGLSHHTATALESGCLAVMKPVLERLVTIIARDAIDGTEVWKTVAFMLLDATVQLSALEKQHVVLSSLNKHGILANFVRSVRDSDGRLQAVLKPDPDDLNTLYIYESKMSLFIRMAQTRAGAERLLEAQLLPILSQCDYVDTRPEADQAFIDQDSFLPSAIQRYHQLLMPALQVVDGMLATLGNRHTTVTRQALEFLSAHGTTIAILLKNEADYVTLPTLEEVHLIVALCSNILPSVPKTELLLPTSGFGAVHLAILGLSTRCLGRGRIFDHIVPQTEAEVSLNQQYAFGYGARTKFEVKVEQKEQLMRKAIITYIGASSEFTEPEITLVLSPVTITAKNGERLSHFSATIPTVGDTLVALDDICNDLSSTLKQIIDISAELANKDHMGLEGAQEILRNVEPSLLRSLDLSQKRALLAQALASTLALARAEARVILDTLEMLLLVLWRHVEYYGGTSAGGPASIGFGGLSSSTSTTLGSSRFGGSMNAPPAKVTVGNAMRLLATAEPSVFREEVASKIGGVLTKLASIEPELDEETFGKDWQDNRGYIQIMTRRLKDSAGLNVGDEESTDLEM